MIGLIYGGTQRNRAVMDELASELGLHYCPVCHQQRLEDGEDCPRCAIVSDSADIGDSGL